MTCSNCQTDNRDSARFCKRCGFWLLPDCPFCNTPLPEAALFCDHCGRPINAFAIPPTQRHVASQTGVSDLRSRPPSPQAPFPALHQFIPSDLLAKLEQSRRSGAMEGERRIVTMLFCDIKGSTEAAQHLDPEVWTELINAAFEQMIRPVYDYEGTVARLMGDGILAFFGAPLAHEDDPQRAVLAGLDILKGFQSFGAQHGTPVVPRIGINTGLVVVGAVGSDLRMEYTAMGDAINLAARMEQTALPGTVQVAEETYRLVAPLFEMEALGGIEVKGRLEPVRAWRVLGSKLQPGRLRGFDGLSAPVVGRQREIGLLTQAVADLRAGRGQVITLIGEAGLGKSRLVAEVKAMWEAGQAIPDVPQNPWPRWCESQGISYDTSNPYVQFQQQLRCLSGGAGQEGVGENQRSLERIVDRLPPDQQSGARAVLGRLLALSSGQAGPLLADGETFRGELYQAVRHIWQTWGQEGPAICVFDDLHWADAASVDLLLHLLPLTETLPLLFLCVFRPDRHAPGWQVKAFCETSLAHRYSEIALQPLDASQSDALVQSLLGQTLGRADSAAATLPEALRKVIVDKADGNPFFVEEMVRSLVDNKVLVRTDDGGWQVADAMDLDQLAVPDSLQSLLTARIDRLEEEVRQTLQLAAVIGRRFFHRVLALVAEAAEQLDQQVLVLQRAELILEAARQPEMEYVFRHSMTQEAAYNTILLRRRREFHRRVGEAIETLFGERLEEFYPVLAHHFHRAGDPRALHYFTLAGDTAFGLYAIAEALTHYSHALELASTANDSRPAQLQHLYLRRGRCLELRNDYRAAQATYQAMQDVALSLGDQAMALAALLARATATIVPSLAQDTVAGAHLLDEAIQLARTLGDEATEAHALWNTLLLNLYTGTAAQGIPAGERAVALARKLGLRELQAHAAQDMGLVYMGSGRLAEARQTLADAEGLWRDLGNLPMLAENRANTTLDRVLTAKFDEAIDLAHESLQISEQIDNRWGQVNSRVFVPMVYLVTGDFDAAWRISSQGLALGDAVGHPAYALCRVWQSQLLAAVGDTQGALAVAQVADEKALHFLPFRSMTIANLARNLLDMGRLDEAVTVGNESARYRGSQTLIVFEITNAFLQSELAMAQGDFVQATANVDALLAWLARIGVSYYLPEAYWLRSRVLRAMGEELEAISALTAGIEIADSAGARHPTWLMLVELADLQAAQGRRDDAQQSRRRTNELIQFILDHTTEPALRPSLLRKMAAVQH